MNEITLLLCKRIFVIAWPLEAGGVPFLSAPSRFTVRGNPRLLICKVRRVEKKVLSACLQTRISAGWFYTY